MNFQRLFCIVLRHAYYPVGPTPLSLSPCPETEASLAGHRALCKTVPRGIDLVQALTPADKPVVAFDTSSVLRFVLRGDAALLEKITDFDDLRDGEGAPVYVRGRRGLKLEHREAEVLPYGAIALVEIGGLPGLLRRASPPKWSIDLAARQGRWRYYVVLDPSPNPASSYALKAEPPRPRVTFEVDEPSDRSDAIAVELRRRCPGKRILRFRSTSLLASSSVPGFSLTLEHEDERLLDELPCPSVDDVCLPLEPGEALSLYHVVRFDKRPASVRGAA